MIQLTLISHALQGHTYFNNRHINLEITVLKPLRINFLVLHIMTMTQQLTILFCTTNKL